MKLETIEREIARQNTNIRRNLKEAKEYAAVGELSRAYAAAERAQDGAFDLKTYIGGFILTARNHDDLLETGDA